MKLPNAILFGLAPLLSTAGSSAAALAQEQDQQLPKHLLGASEGVFRSCDDLHAAEYAVELSGEVTFLRPLECTTHQAVRVAGPQTRGGVSTAAAVEPAAARLSTEPLDLVCVETFASRL